MTMKGRRVFIRNAGKLEKKRQRRGFTLLEVMVALAVLAINMGVIMVGQSQTFSRANVAKDTIGAVAVARAKVLELEHKFAIDGFGDFDKEGDEECDRDLPMYRCEWTLKRIELPISQMLEATAAKAGEVQAAAAAAISDPGRSGGPTPSDARGSVVAMLANFKGPVQMIQEQLEELIRELRVTVKWREGKDAREWESFSLVTHLVNLNPRGATTGLVGAAAAGGIPGVTAATAGAAAGLVGAATSGITVPATSGRIGSVGAAR